jgi:hypothetical protein
MDRWKRVLEFQRNPPKTQKRKLVPPSSGVSSEERTASSGADVDTPENPRETAASEQ